MKYYYSKLLSILVLVLFLTSNSYAQNNKALWLKTSKSKISKSEKVLRKSEPKKAFFYQLDINQLKTQLINAPLRGKSSKSSNVIIQFPNSGGEMESFRVKEAPVMVPEMQISHPDMRSYVGQSIEDPTTLIRFSVTPLGLNSMTLSSKQGTQFIDPYTKDGENYIVYSKNDLTPLKEPFICYVEDIAGFEDESQNAVMNKNANDGMMREFRLALACSAEYGNFHGGTEVLIKAAMMNTMTRVNGIYERELSITMLMVENASIIYFGDVNADPYTNDDGSAMLGENQEEIDAKILESNYDIGHVFSTGGGGIAGLGVVCVWQDVPPSARKKARGVTGLNNPVGDAFDVDFVSHEIGHQFGAPHTFNSIEGSCSGNRTASNAYEPGSGSTIMAYAGICSPENVQINSDDYFHQKSLQMIWANITSGNSTCASTSATGNATPTAEAGNNYTIPILTPYKLTGSSTDEDGIDSHTYTWEQYDLGPSGPSTETTATGPLVRSFKGTDNPIRYVPRLSDLRNSNGSTTWEKLSSLDNRVINFQLTVRDNDPDGGQTATDNMMITTTNAAGPFLVTSQNTTGVSWVQNSSEEITWDPANTDVALSVDTVNILLSTDGGLTYPINLTPGGTNNNGSAFITVPNILAPYCRVMVEAVGNVFFAINTMEFAIGYNVSTICNQYSQSPNFAIPDNGDVLSQFNMEVPQSVTITDINIGVDITHTYIGDLQVSVLSPNGTQVNLLTPGTCGGEENLIIKFDDSGETFSCSIAPSDLILQSPTGLLSDWNGEESSGTWVFGVIDTALEDTGTLNSWYVEICETTITPLSTDDYALSNFSIFPNPNHGEFTLKLKSISNNISVSVHDMRGRSLFFNSYKNTPNLNENINLSHLQSGMYLVKVTDGDRSASKKIIIN